MGVDHGGMRGTSPPPPEVGVGNANANSPSAQIWSYRYKKERYVAFKIRQNPFSAEAPPRSPLGKLTTLPRPSSLLGGDTPPIPHSTWHRPTFGVRHASPPEVQPYRSRRLITLIWSHTCQFVISCITTVAIHYSFSLPLQTQNSFFQQIVSSVVFLPFHPPDWLHGLQVLFDFLGHVGSNFG